jgi:hypothetical protein
MRLRAAPPASVQKKDEEVIDIANDFLLTTELAED